MDRRDIIHPKFGTVGKIEKLEKLFLRFVFIYLEHFGAERVFGD